MANKRKPLGYEFDLDVPLQTTIDMFEQDREAYWESRLEAEEWSPLKDLLTNADDTARLIRSRALSLQNVGDLSEVTGIYQAYRHDIELESEAAKERYAKLELLIREKRVPKESAEQILNSFRPQQWSEEDVDPTEERDRPLRLIWERLCVDDAREAVNGIRERVRRTLELERVVRKLLGREDAPDACIEFLSLVSRCYIFGFVPECVAMCRSALEQALRGKVSDDHCRIAGQKETRHGFTLGARIEAAFHPANKLLDPARIDPALARRVRDTGDTAVHKDPTIAKDALGTIRSTLVLVDALARLP